MVIRKKTRARAKAKTGTRTRARIRTTGADPSARKQTAVDEVDKQIESMESGETAIQDNEMKANTTTDTSAMESKNNLTSIVLDPVITITEAGSLYKHLQSYIDSEDDVTIDASKVQMIDMAGLQLLLVFARELGKLQRKVHWQSPSSVFMQAAELMDLSRRLRLKNT